jgi:hypothetical protein
MRGRKASGRKEILFRRRGATTLSRETSQQKKKPREENDPRAG